VHHPKAVLRKSRNSPCSRRRPLHRAGPRTAPRNSKRSWNTCRRYVPPQDRLAFARHSVNPAIWREGQAAFPARHHSPKPWLLTRIRFTSHRSCSAPSIECPGWRRPVGHRPRPPQFPMAAGRIDSGSLTAAQQDSGISPRIPHLQPTSAPGQLARSTITMTRAASGSGDVGEYPSPPITARHERR